MPTECALKVYKTTLNEFVTRDKYIIDDFRFKDRFSKQNPRKVINMWAEKEYHNLNRYSYFGYTPGLRPSKEQFKVSLYFVQVACCWNSLPGSCRTEKECSGHVFHRHGL